MLKVVKFKETELVPASHENPEDPGVLKRVMISAADKVAGTIQMVNWAELMLGRTFDAHYHENMTEIFVVFKGRILLECEQDTVELEPGDAALVPARARHRMRNLENDPAHYIVCGVSSGEGGKTINTPDFFDSK